ncbi:MAG: peptidoglycan DD-metalloendopeptidase family protein [Leptolyngbya sp. SIO3F4]|nr:peptidoglycan DD-metalloendopeptidase family protein [Leptolyngbya sp. SIO3F4]
MTGSEHRFTKTIQKSSSASQLLKLSAFAAVGLLSTQAVVAQTEAGAIELTIPQSAPAAPVAPTFPAEPAVPEPTVIAPEVVESVTPNSVVPSSIETTSSEPTTVDYGTVFLEPASQSGIPSISSLREDTKSTDNGEVPSVEVISPADYSTGQIDPTDYSVGATMPDVVISERSSGCEFSLETRNQVSKAACRQVGRLTTAIGDIVPAASYGNNASLNIPNISIPGLQATGLTTTASREYYNQTAEKVVKLQSGEKFIFPLSIPASLTSLFGWRIHPISGDYRFHTGTDVGAPLGTPVVATQPGQVVLSDYAGGYGLMVVLHHNEGTLESRYAHLSRSLVDPGEWVEQGEVIGLVGSTGNSTGPHLHFELRQLTDSGWVALNPDSLLQKTLGTLARALGNSLTALSGGNLSFDLAEASDEATIPLEGLPFRPAQPHAN